MGSSARADLGQPRGFRPDPSQICTQRAHQPASLIITKPARTRKCTRRKRFEILRILIYNKYDTIMYTIRLKNVGVSYHLTVWFIIHLEINTANTKYTFRVHTRDYININECFGSFDAF